MFSSIYRDTVRSYSRIRRYLRMILGLGGYSITHSHSFPGYLYLHRILGHLRMIQGLGGYSVTHSHSFPGYLHTYIGYSDISG